MKSPSQNKWGLSQRISCHTCETIHSPLIKGMTGDLNTTFEHRPIKKGGEAATRTLNQMKAKQKAHLCRCAFMLISSLFLPTIPANQDYSLKRNVSLSLLSYRHPERSRGIFVAAALLFPLLIRLHEAPYPTFMEYQASRFRSHAYTISARTKKISRFRSK